MQNITEKIGEDYTRWKQKDVVLIKAPTGSGKSYFILHTLLYKIIDDFYNYDKYPITITTRYQSDKNFMCNGNIKMLYLVNRKILKDQLEEELYKLEIEWSNNFNGMPFTLSNFIDIETYQSIEKILKNNKIPNYLPNYLAQYYYVVYDECHYFYNDSNFNTYTQLSYDCLRMECQNAIQIFISATMENIEKTIKNDIPEENIFSYEINTDYSYIHLNVLKSKSMLKEKIEETVKSKRSNKWLIFVDSIKEGEKLKEEISSIQKGLLKEDVVFIDAEYDTDNGTKSTVDEIVENQYTNKKIIIATSVMDNGISFHDKDLRNIVIMADTKESFIQMLGRKRQDGKDVNLYILKRDVRHFSGRLKSISEILKLFKKYYKTNFANMYTISIPMPYGSIRQVPCTLYQMIRNGFILPDVSNQQRVLKELLENEDKDIPTKLIYTFWGFLAINKFSLTRCRQLYNFYRYMKDALSKDSDAFIKKQAEWLNLDMQAITVLEGEKERTLKEIKEKIMKLYEKEFNVDENKEFKKVIKEDLLYLLKEHTDENDEECKKRLKEINKTDRTFSDDTFNWCMEILNLPYQMSKPSKNTFLITINDKDE